MFQTLSVSIPPHGTPSGSDIVLYRVGEPFRLGDLIRPPVIESGPDYEPAGPAALVTFLSTYNNEDASVYLPVWGQVFQRTIDAMARDVNAEARRARSRLE